MTTAIFLGAGASAAEGAPIQSQLFQRYFSSRSVEKYPEIFQELSHFFKAIFSIDLNDDAQIDGGNFPTFEEALGILDLSEARRESFRDFDFAGANPQGNKAQLLRLYLILAMSKAIADGLTRSPGSFHSALIAKLKEQQLLTDTIFISTNYDLVIDEALGFEVDYGVDFSGQSKFGSKRNAPAQGVTLFKLHGSLNWLYCPVCNNLNSYESKVVLSLMSEDKPVTKCEFCQSVMSPMIVPPTFYKDMSRVFLGNIWNKCENALRNANHLILCGYSLPDADMHIKYLLKRMQTNRAAPAQVRLTIFNHRDGKTADEARMEEQRYQRFFGPGINYTRKSFQDFVQDPAAVYAQPIQ
jgi:NAD-dependent SIR2 family protein deacetylase